MDDFSQAVGFAARMVFELDSDLLEIVSLSLRITLTAVLIASIIGLPLGAFLAIRRFPTRKFWIGLLAALMGLPPVVAGLAVYLFLSSSGPLGPLELLFTPTAMIIVQVVLVLPIVASLTQQAIYDLYADFGEQLRSWYCGSLKSIQTLLWEGRFSLMTAILAGFGRAVAEVGGVLIVGGNINHSTRVMTTAIALETSKGNLALSLALGLILIVLSLLITFSAQFVSNIAKTYDA